MRTTAITKTSWIAALLIASLGAGAAAQSRAMAEPTPEERAPDLARARSALERWVETRQVISAERRDARLAKEVLEDRIALVEREIDALRTRIADVERSITESAAKRDELAARDAELAAAAERGTARFGEIARRTARLLPRLPDALRERVTPLSRRLTEPAGAAAAPSLGERARDLVGILNEANRSQSDVTVGIEIRQLGDGRTAEVHVLRLGLAQAFYVSADGRSAGFGLPGEEGWEWTEDGTAAPAIAQAVAILRSEQTAAFVALPVRIR